MLRAALATWLALASVWEGPVARTTDVYNDTCYGFLNETNFTAFRRDEFQPPGCLRAIRSGNLSSPIGPGLTGLDGVDVGQLFADNFDVNMSQFHSHRYGCRFTRDRRNGPSWGAKCQLPGQ